MCVGVEGGGGGCVCECECICVCACVCKICAVDNVYGSMRTACVCVYESMRFRSTTLNSTRAYVGRYLFIY